MFIYKKSGRKWRKLNWEDGEMGEKEGSEGEREGVRERERERERERKDSMFERLSITSIFYLPSGLSSKRRRTSNYNKANNAEERDHQKPINHLLVTLVLQTLRHHLQNRLEPLNFLVEGLQKLNLL